MMLSALTGKGLVELQRELASLDPKPAITGTSANASEDATSEDLSTNQGTKHTSSIVKSTR